MDTHLSRYTISGHVLLEFRFIASLISFQQCILQVTNMTLMFILG